MDGAVIIIDPMIRGLRLFNSAVSFTSSAVSVIIIDPMIRGLRLTIGAIYEGTKQIVIIIDPMIRGLRQNVSK